MFTAALDQDTVVLLDGQRTVARGRVVHARAPVTALASECRSRATPRLAGPTSGSSRAEGKAKPKRLQVRLVVGVPTFHPRLGEDLDEEALTHGLLGLEGAPAVVGEHFHRVRGMDAPRSKGTAHEVAEQQGQRWPAVAAVVVRSWSAPRRDTNTAPCERVVSDLFKDQLVQRTNKSLLLWC